MESKLSQAIETLIVHGFTPKDPIDLSPPIHLSSTFRFQSAQAAAKIFDGSEKGYVYSRIANPTVDLLEEKLALLEDAEAAVAVGSGMAAVSATTLTLAKPGDNFIACTTIYGGTFAFFNDHMPEFGITARFVAPRPDLTASELIDRMDNNTRFLFMETPANPTLSILDIKVWADAAKALGIPLIVDNTFATPYLQRPISHGAHLVIHSATKYLGGHADVIGGAVAGNAALVGRIRTGHVHHFGPVLGPMSAWLILRGMKTLAIRMDRHCQNAQKVARYLSAHPKVTMVHYPGLPDHPGHGVAKRQMSGFGGMISFEVAGGVPSGQCLMNAVKLCTLAVSLGDCDTLIQHPASMTHSTYSPEDRKQAGIPDGLIRLSVGIEHVDDIIADLDQALTKV